MAPTQRIAPKDLQDKLGELIESEDEDCIADFKKTENIAITRDKVHASKLHLINKAKPLITHRSTEGFITTRTLRDFCEVMHSLPDDQFLSKAFVSPR
jgi:hypothetical protein